jgi:hypothetical protein
MFALGSLTSRNAGKSNPYAYQVTRMPALPPTPSRSSPKGDVELGKHACVSGGIEEVHSGTSLKPAFPTWQ